MGGGSAPPRTGHAQSPIGELVIGLAADLAEVEAAIRRCHSTTLSLQRLVRVAANLSGLMCLLYVKLDEWAAFRLWADTARAAATEADHANTYAGASMARYAMISLA